MRARTYVFSPALVPCLLAAGYVVMLAGRFPQLVSWENADSDITSAYTLADAISHGHTGQVVLSTQGSWVPLWYGLLTHGLSFHRVLWEISPALLMLVTAFLIGWSVARIATRPAAALTVGLIVAASPTALLIFTAAFFHNTTVPGVAILGAYLVWLAGRPHPPGMVVASALLVSAVIGTFLASDELLGVVGILPFLAIPVFSAVKRRDRTMLAPIVAVTIGSVLVARITASLMRSFLTTTPHPQLNLASIGSHITWLVQGLLRMGNGLSVAPHSSVRTPLVAAAGIVTVCALGATFWLAGHMLRHSSTGDIGRARDLHGMFWAVSLLCAAGAYVVTTAASEPSDRYFIVAVPAVAATVPLLTTGRRAEWLVAAGASVFIAASIVGLAAGDERTQIYRGADVQQAARIEALVQSQHLGVGYAGYWDAASLTWTTHEHLHVYPITDVFGPTEPTAYTQVRAWYQPRPHTSSYLLLSPGDDVLADRLPTDLPRPQHEFRIGAVTLAVWAYDIAAYFHPPSR